MFHFSGKAGKTVNGHQVVCVAIVCGDLAIPCVPRFYDGIESKTGFSAAFAAEAPRFGDAECHVLMDSWYTCGKVVNAFTARGFNVIAALKSNRLLHTGGAGGPVSVAELAAEAFKPADTPAATGADANATEAPAATGAAASEGLGLVTANGKDYHYVVADCALNGIKGARVVACCPEGKLGEKRRYRAFMCTSTALDAEETLAHYVNRWKIEVIFKNLKSMGFDKYMVRKLSKIKRVWLLLQLACLVFTCEFSPERHRLAEGRQVIAKIYFDDTEQYDYKKEEEYKKRRKETKRRKTKSNAVEV